MLGVVVMLSMIVTFFMWALFGHQTDAERQRVIDSSCAVNVKQVRYPDGMRTPVCNPTGQTWRP